MSDVERLLPLLRCPQTREPLELAARDLVERLNARIGRRALESQRGARVEHRMDGALVREDGTVAYPIWDGVPHLIVDDAIPLDQL